MFDKSVIKLHFSALSHIDMIDWTITVITPSPLLSSTYYDDMEQLDVNSFKGIPCHFQAVERCIKDVSATTLKVVGHNDYAAHAIQGCITKS